MLLDNELRTAWRNQAKQARGPVAGAIRMCNEARGGASDNALYQGAQWASTLQACLVAWAATDKPEHAQTAIKFFTALLDDLDHIGDGKGGDASGQRDSGYAIRNLGPYTALAYDWLWNQLSPAQREHARQRWAAWLSWYDRKGYRARTAGTNYQAGYLAASTMIAIAQGNEAAEQDGAARWQYVADELWAKDMKRALAPGGILEGGDWAEGWQYGPLAVAHYALAARVAKRAGIDVTGVDVWLASLLRRHVYGLTPGDRMLVGHDTEAEEPHLEPNVLVLNAIALGDARREDQKWARGELGRLGLVDKNYFLYDALAGIGEYALIPRETWPAWYVAPATGALYARTRWDGRAVWFSSECQGGLDVDHRQPKAGTFVLSRGKDDLIVDPSPYGSLSTLTSNAPTVASRQLPANYIPSQASWGTRMHWEWITRSSSGVLAARCDYADAYRFQHRRSDVAEARRDFVLVPGPEGTNAALVVVDRARSGAENRPLFLRFHVRGNLGLEGDVATKVVGSSRLTIRSIARTGGTPAIGQPEGKDCFGEGVVRGRCEAARFPASALALEVPGPAPQAVHVLDVSEAGQQPIAARTLAGEGFAGVQLVAPRETSIIWPTKSGALRYRAPAGTHVVLDAPATEGKATISATRDGAACAVTIAPGGETPVRPAILTVDKGCNVRVDPASVTALAARPSELASRRAGCCAATPDATSPLLLAGFVTLALRTRPSSRRRRRSCGLV
jgi:hypothetical protein